MMATNTPTFKSDIYKSIASNQLVVYSIHSLYNDGDEISSEDIISACFILFPQKFSLKKYPQWPDSALIGRRLNDCRGNGLIAAKIDTGYKLTAKGSRLAEKAAKTLGVAHPKVNKPSQPKKTVRVPGKKAGSAPTKKALPAPVRTPLRNKREQKIEVEQELKAEGKKVQNTGTDQRSAPIGPAVKTRPVKQKSITPAKKVSPTPLTMVSKVKQESKAEGDKAVLPFVKVNTQKQILPAKKVLPNSAVEATKARQRRKAVPTMLKVRAVKQKRNVSIKKVLTIPVFEMPNARQEKKSNFKLKSQPTVVLVKMSSPKLKQNAPVKKGLPVPVPVLETTKVKLGQNEIILTPAIRVKSHPAKQKRTVPIKRIFPTPLIKIPKVKQDESGKDAPPAIAVKVDPKKQKRTAPVKKALPLPVKETPKVKQEQKVKNIQPVTSSKTDPLKQKQTTSTKKVMPSPIDETPKVKQEEEIIPAEVTTGISQEAKVRAGKFVRMMEMSDAYIQYKKNGKEARINEFDFRSLLLCTMESSPETLARNVELFKGYADLHNRRDLTSFLAYCADKFSHIFAPQKKAIRKIK